jgi:hypothetical protein
MNFLPPFFQQYISPATAGQTPPSLGEKKFTPQSSVAPQVRSGSASATPQEPNRFGGLDFSALPKKLVPDTSLPKQRLNLLA